MSFFHKKLDTLANQIQPHTLEPKGFKQDLDKVIVEHIAEVQKELKESKTLHDLLAKYFGELEAIADLKDKPGWGTQAKPHLDTARDLVPAIVAEAKILFRRSHKFLR